jgi:hypothetical protein
MPQLRTQANGATESPLWKKWPHARLIPSAGIRSELERERRATSCLLAVMHGVPEFGHALLAPLEVSKGSAIETFAEVRFKNVDAKTVIPDGAIVCTRGQREWVFLVEVKTGNNGLRDDQVSSYLDIARENGFGGVLTISNQITANPTESPISLDGRKLRKVSLWHLSWWRILTEAVVQSRYRGVSDPDQAWILRELIHYLSSEASGTYGFEDMGEHWVSVRKAVAAGTIRPSDKATKAVAEHWEQFTQYLCLSLAQELGRTVDAVRSPRGQTTPDRLDDILNTLSETGVLEATLRIPDAVGDLEIRGDLRARQTSTGVIVDAPTQGRPKSRITWLLRQLDGAPDDLIIEARYPYGGSVPANLAQAKESPNLLLHPQDPKREPKTFVLTLTRPMGQKRGRMDGSFVHDTSAQTVAFYRDLVQNLKSWQPRAPKILSTDPKPGLEAESDERPIEPAWTGESSSEVPEQAATGPVPPPDRNQLPKKDRSPLL